MRLFIIRHAEPYYPTDSLTEKGFREAELLADRLCREPITHFYVSPMGRARRTAEPTLKRFQKEAVVFPWLQELPVALTETFTTRWGESRWQWDMPPELWMPIPDIWQPNGWRSIPMYQAEGLPAYYDMVTENFDKLLASHGFSHNAAGYFDVLPNGEENRDTIAIFCHMGLGTMLLAHLLQLPLPVISMSLFLPTSSVTTVFFERHTNTPVANARIISVGDTSHLYAGGEAVSPSGLFAEEIR